MNRLYRERAVALLLLLALPAGVLAAETTADSVAKPGASASEASPRKKLRFRDGPVCLCADGLTEKEIAAGRSRRDLRPAPASQEVPGDGAGSSPSSP